MEVTARLSKVVTSGETVGSWFNSGLGNRQMKAREEMVSA